MTDRVGFRFTVKESASGTPWIAAEPTHEMLGNQFLKQALIGFDLKPEANLEQAQAIAAYMRKHIKGMRFGGSRRIRCQTQGPHRRTGGDSQESRKLPGMTEERVLAKGVSN